MKASFPGEIPFQRTAVRWSAVALLTVGLSFPAFAALGDASDSVQADQAQMKARVNLTTADTYAVYAITAPNGTVVREYVSPDGRVFGVAWQGPFVPSMKQLLGNYFQHYSQAAKAQRESVVGHRPLNIHEPGLVVQTAGHMLAFSGRAFDPGLLPAGVSANDIR